MIKVFFLKKRTYFFSVEAFVLQIFLLKLIIIIKHQLSMEITRESNHLPSSSFPCRLSVAVKLLEWLHQTQS